MKKLDIAIAIIRRDGKVLATQRRSDADHLPGVWEFPGGKCEDGETPEQCCTREVAEEVGAGVEITRAYAPIVHHYPERIVTLYPFDCAIITGEPRAIECTQLRWVAPGELDEADFPPANAELIRSLRAGRDE
jgi:8-oxo-dGTP diphosphatase